MAEESIYNLIPRPAPVIEKPPMHRSKFPGDAPPTYSTFGASASSQILETNVGGDYVDMARVHRHKQEHAHFGPKEPHKGDPSIILKKQSKPELPPPKRFEYTDRRKEAVVKRDEGATLKARTNKNFIAKNTTAAVTSVAKKPVDTTVNFLAKPEYGKTPEYLHTVKAEIFDEKQIVQNAVDKQRALATAGQPKHVLLPEDERVQLLESLKKKHDAVNKQYQNLTHVVSIDSTAKIRKKESYERELAELEHAMDRLQKKYVFVEDAPQL